MRDDDSSTVDCVFGVRCSITEGLDLILELFYDAKVADARDKRHGGLGRRGRGQKKWRSLLLLLY